MRIRDGFATINGIKTEYEMPSGSLEIIADDGKTLFGISLEEGKIRIDSGNFCKHEGIVLDDRIEIHPIASNVVLASRPKYKRKK
jgi:hypothetical protein